MGHRGAIVLIIAADSVPTPAFAEAMANAEHVRQRPTPAAAFNRAREQFRAGTRLDMAALAADLGVGRTTLYRWTGDRDRLLGDVSVAELGSVFDYLEAETTGTGAGRLERIVSTFLEGLTSNTAFLRFLEQEGEHGFRLVTAADGRVRPYIVGRLTHLIEHERDTHGYQPAAAPAVLADGIVALGERYLYHNGSAAMNPDPATARTVIRLLLREG